MHGHEKYGCFLARKGKVKQGLNKAGGVVWHTPRRSKPDFPSWQTQAPMGHETASHGCDIPLTVDDRRARRTMIKDVTGVVALLNVPHLEEAPLPVALWQRDGLEGRGPLA
jgi:hypothetical protein